MRRSGASLPKLILPSTIASMAALARSRFAALVLTSLLSSPALAETVRDDFNSQSFSNNDGGVNWATSWIENDSFVAGPIFGNVTVRAQGDLQLNNFFGISTQPSAAREVDLDGVVSATLTFDWAAVGSLEASDAVTLEISSNGGSSWTTLEVFSGYTSTTSGSRSFDILGFASVDTQIRFRVSNAYGGFNENFRVDFVEIEFETDPPDLEISKMVAPAAGVATGFVLPGTTMVYEIELVNTGAGPVDGDSLIITDAIPASMALRVADFDTLTPGPVAFDPGSVPSGLSYTFGALGDLTDDVEFSANGGVDNYQYVPTADASGTDTSVTHIRIRPSGSMLGNTGSGDPTVQFRLLMVLQ